ncbi:hypothetical protein B0H12DRAFT_1069566 [Mycena haematopus]|nr:hypothetical protein B0H12DRAFT_1069566 [Mycena haematopus]
MLSTGETQNPAEATSALGTEFYSVSTAYGQDTRRTSSPHASDVSVSSRSITAHSTRGPSPGPTSAQFTTLMDDDGLPYNINTIKGHLGTAHEHLYTTTAILAEQQETTDGIQDALQVVRAEVLSRLESLLNEVHSHQSRINRCLDDNVRILRETGASRSQLQGLLQSIAKVANNPENIDGSTRVNHPTAHPRESIPPDIQSQAAAILPPRQPTEDQADFDKRAAVKLKSKEHKHLAFPLPTPPSAAPRPATKLDALHKSARFGQLPSIEEYTSVGSASRTGTAQQMRHARHWCGASHIAHMTANSQRPQ